MGKFALLIGVSQTSEEELPELPSAIEDIRAMQAVLQNPDLGGFDSADVKILPNPTRQEMEEAIETLFAKCKKDDLVLFYFSGHGITDERGKLYLVTPQTRKEQGNLIKATAVAATVLHENMGSCRSKHQVLILDSCFSGAIAEGLTGKSAESKVDIQRELGGEGRAILTSSNAVQKSFHIQGYDLSIYTHYLIDGIQTGAANQDGDDYISADELHEYAKKKLEQEAPAMSPQFFPVKEGYKIRLVRSPKPKGDPELEYRKEAEARLHQGEFSPTATRLLKRKRDQLGLSLEQAEAIEAEIKKPWQERQRKLQEYEENLLEELKRHTPLSDRTLSELSDYRKELGLRPEDVQPIHQKLNVSMVAIAPPASPPPNSPPPPVSPAPAEEIALKSEKGIDYTKLRELLKVEDWKAADRETYLRMLQAVGRKEGEWLRPEELSNFPCIDLKTIDALWIKYSNGHFGFSVQADIYVECGGRLDGKFPSSESWRKFGDRVGWRKGGQWLGYDDFAPLLSSPQGTFPVFFLVGFLDLGWGRALFYRTKTCECSTSPKTKPTSAKAGNDINVGRTGSEETSGAASSSTEKPAPLTTEDDLRSEKGIDYTKLRDLLKAQRWKEADYETYLRMLQAVGRKEGDWIRSEELQIFPRTDLRTIDALWIKYSNGHFGFSVQREIYAECGGTLDGKAPNDQVWQKFGDRVGWRKGGEWLNYNDLATSLSSSGNFPVFGVWDGGIGGGRFSSLAQRLVNCSTSQS